MASNSEASTIKVLSWNINGLKAKLKDKERNKELQETINEYDVVLLQEIRIGPKGAEEDNTDLGILIKYLNGYNMVRLTYQEEQNGQQNNHVQTKTMYLTYFNSRRRGVAIIINKPHTYLRGLFRGGDYAWVHVEIDGQKFTFMSVYYHEKERADLMNSMSSLLREGSEAFQRRLIIGGDFNTTLNPDLDARKRNRAHDAQRERLQEFLTNRRLSDVWREKNLNQHQYTFSTQEPRSRLDYIFMLNGELGNVQNCEIDQTIDLSDHFPVMLTLKTSDREDLSSQISELSDDLSGTLTLTETSNLEDAS